MIQETQLSRTPEWSAKQGGRIDSVSAAKRTMTIVKIETFARRIRSKKEPERSARTRSRKNERHRPDYSNR